jgi:hypothetical protein
MECGYHTALILPDRIQLAVQNAFKTKNSVFRCDERIAGQVIRRYVASDRLAGLVGPALLGIFCCVGKPVRESDGLAPIGQAYLFAISAGWQSTTLAEGLDNSSIADQCGGWSAKPRRKRD